MIINRGAAEVNNHISRDDIFDYHPIRKCNIYFIIQNIRSIIFLGLYGEDSSKGKIIHSLLHICMNENTSFTKMVLLDSLNDRADHDIRLNK